MPSKSPEVLSQKLKAEIYFHKKKGAKFSTSKFAKESGLEVICLMGVKDPEEIKRRETQMYRMIHEIIKVMLMSGQIKFIGMDRLYRNGGRGKPPRIYEAMGDIIFKIAM